MKKTGGRKSCDTLPLRERQNLVRVTDNSKRNIARALITTLRERQNIARATDKLLSGKS